MHVGSLHCVICWFVDTNAWFPCTSGSKDATVILMSRGPLHLFITVATSTSQYCFSFQYQIAHLLSSKQRKHNLWLKINNVISSWAITESPGRECYFAALQASFVLVLEACHYLLLIFDASFDMQFSPWHARKSSSLSMTACEVLIRGSHRAENVLHRKLCQPANAVIIADCRLTLLHHPNQYVIRHIMQNP